ncbi:sigma-54 interaction domain-containing protein [Paenibacillus sp. MBLB4367]|uniref:sigma-54 interaction domain-containing protein n=1 Tax=Paenibacillus sp. MBLB4367 TaxID=3384767 RepID=UPI003907F00E
MLRFGHLPLIRSYVSVSPKLSGAEASKQHKAEPYVVIESDPPYVLTANEFAAAAEEAGQRPVIEALEKAAIAPSSVLTAEELSSADPDWARPLLIRREAGGGWDGIVTAAELAPRLIKEHKQLWAYFMTLAETVGDAVTAVDKFGKVLCWNTAAEQTYDIKREQIVGQTIGEHFEAESIMLYRILDEGRTVRQVYHQPTADKHVLINASPIVEANEIIGGIATEHDITRVVRLNKELYEAPLWLEHERPVDLFMSVDGMQPAIKQALKVASTDSAVLLIGEHGSENELLAQAVHDASARQNGPFLSVNCGAFPAGILETELFGYQSGAFTGAEPEARPGKLEQAGGGTLFIDEIDELPAELQVKLLQTIEQGSFTRPGFPEPIRVNARIIASAAPVLYDKWKQGIFKSSLYYKLSAVSITIPPLRERTEDIPQLVQFFLRQFSAKYQKPLPRLDTPVMSALMNYDWPGNVRELQQVAERFVLLQQDNGTVRLEDVPKEMLADTGEDAVEDAGTDMLLKARVSEEQEAAMIEEALRKTYGNKSAAAKLLGISRATLYNKMREYGLG